MSRKSKHKKNNRGKFIFFIIYVILFAMLIYSVINIFIWYKDNKNNQKLAQKINNAVIVQKDDNNEKEYNIDFSKLKEQNSDTVAWVGLESLNIEYPIVQTKDNEYYLEHSFDKSENTAGWIFADYRNKLNGKDKNIVIYGHNRKDGSMFGDLHKALNSDWYDNENNRKIVFITENEKSTYQIFSVYEIKKESYYINTDFSNDKQFEKFINTIKNRSIKNFNVDVSKDDTILTLSTCSDKKKYRVVIHAKKIINEKS